MPERVTQRRRVEIRTANSNRARVDHLAVEAPLELRVDGEAWLTTMRTPGHDVELAHGLLLAEGVITRADQVAVMRHCAEDVVEVTLRDAVPPARRPRLMSSACGVCGKAEIAELKQRATWGIEGPQWPLARVVALPDLLREAQRQFERTGGTHAAGLFGLVGEPLVVREDVGRHNAVDKVLGWALMQGLLPLRAHALQLSGRASFELLQKAWLAGVPVVSAVSAPSSLAVEVAEEAGVTLAGFVRDGQANLYTHPERITSDGAASDECVVGIDLAWKAPNRSGLAALDGTGRLIALGQARADDEIHQWLAQLPHPVSAVGLDAPLVVPNLTGQRVGETALARDFGRFAAAPYPANRGNPLFAPPRAETLAQRWEWEVDPTRRPDPTRPGCIEVYPHPAMVSLFNLPRSLPYKAGRGRSVADRRSVFEQLIGLVESLQQLDVVRCARWHEIVGCVQAASRHSELNAVEHELDAVVCAYVAWLWRFEPDRLVTYGDVATGYIVTLPPPT